MLFDLRDIFRINSNFSQFFKQKIDFDFYILTHTQKATFLQVHAHGIFRYESVQKQMIVLNCISLAKISWYKYN